MPGTFTLRPIQANITHNTDFLGKMDPYCSCRVGTERIKGPVCRNGGNCPKWDDATINIPSTNQSSMVVDLLDKDKILSDDNIGSFVIDLQEVQTKGHISKWYPLYLRQKPAGEILLEVDFQPEMIQQQQPIMQEKPLELLKPDEVSKSLGAQPIVNEEIITNISSESEHYLPKNEKIDAITPHNVLESKILNPSSQSKQFTSGVFIQGISQIHYGNQVPIQSSIVNQGNVVNTNGIQSSVNQSDKVISNTNNGIINLNSTEDKNQGLAAQSAYKQSIPSSESFIDNSCFKGSLNQQQNLENELAHNIGGPSAYYREAPHIMSNMGTASTQSFTNKVLHPEHRY